MADLKPILMGITNRNSFNSLKLSDLKKKDKLQLKTKSI
jgi:hypothetical protein